MNKIIITGNMVKDAEVITAANGIKIARFSIAVRRRTKNENGEYESDFFNCSAFRNSAEFIEKYLSKGSRVTVFGRLENRCWENNGEKKYYTEIIVDEIEGTAAKTTLEKEIAIGNLKPTDEDLPF